MIFVEDRYRIYSYVASRGYTQITPLVNALDVIEIQRAINQMPLCENYEQGSVSIVRIDATYKNNNRMAYAITIRNHSSYFVIIDADTSFYVKKAGSPMKDIQPLNAFHTF
jgi:hypothetical protein